MATHIADHVSIDPRAEIDDDVQIGPFCVIGPHVKIGAGTTVADGPSPRPNARGSSGPEPGHAHCGQADGH